MSNSGDTGAEHFDGSGSATTTRHEKPYRDTSDRDSMQREIPGSIGSATGIPPALLLTRAIETEVIPRLLIAHRRNPSLVKPPVLPSALEGREGKVFFAAPRPAAASLETEIAALGRIVVADDAEAAIAYVEEIWQDGRDLEWIFLQLLAGTARDLGRQWEEDTRSFVEVTLGLMRLQQVVRHFSQHFMRDVCYRTQTRRILLAPCPGEVHTFGLSMLEEFFRKDGWHVVRLTETTQRDITDAVSHSWFDVIGLSASCQTSVEIAARLVRTAREHALNPGLLVMVGGELFNKEPERVRRAEADMSASDAREAVEIANATLAAFQSDDDRGQRDKGTGDRAGERRSQGARGLRQAGQGH